MSYKLALAPQVEKQLTSFPLSLQYFTQSQLEALAKAPTLLSRTGSPATRGQLFEFIYDRGGISLWITVVFQYSQDEQTLHIERLNAEFGS